MAMRLTASSVRRRLTLLRPSSPVTHPRPRYWPSRLLHVGQRPCERRVETTHFGLDLLGPPTVVILVGDLEIAL